MSEKTFKIVNDDISDGYHTFDELYDHRNMLWISLALMMDDRSDFKVEWVREHFAGWDLIVVEDYSRQTQEMPYEHKQLSYHVPAKLRPLYEARLKEIAAMDHKFDGHTSQDVLARLEKFIRGF